MQKRIRSLKRNFPHIQLNKSYYVAVMLNEKIEAYAIKAGFRKELNLGDIVLPDGKCGPVSDFNANGKEVINKSRGKEKKNYDAIWRHEEFRGRDERETVTSIVTRTVTRWCRDRVPPPEVQLTVIENSNKERFIVCPLSLYNTQNETLFLHMVNLLLEIFKECTILDETISNIIISLFD